MTGRTRIVITLSTPILLVLIVLASLAVRGIRQHLREDNVIWDLKQMAFGLAYYAQDNETYPASIDDLFPYMFPPELLASDLHKHALFCSPYGPAPDGGPDYLFRTDLAGRSFDDIPDTAILAIDRAALLRGRAHVIVLLASGATWDPTPDELRNRLAQPENHALAKQLHVP